MQGPWLHFSVVFKRQKITTVGSELPENITFQGKRQKKSAMGRSVPKRWAQVDFTAAEQRYSVGGRKRQRYPGRDPAATEVLCGSSIDMYNNDVGKRFMK